MEKKFLIKLDRKNKTVYKIIRIPNFSLEVPNNVTESLARAYLPLVIEFYKDENNMREYEEWKKQQDEQSNQSKLD